MSDSRPIGVFDSGMGGLTVLAELVRELPGEDFIYLGDTARVPYGSRSQRTVQRYSQEVAAHLLKENIKYLVIACNTATAHAEDVLTQALPIPLLGVIKPGVEAMLQQTGNLRVGVIGTRATVKSGAYEKAIRDRKPDALVYSKACPLFVPIVEEGWTDKKVTNLVIQEYLSEMVREDVDTVVLGCTHYPLLKKAIHTEFPGLKLIDSSVEMARAVRRDLGQRGLAWDRAAGGSVRILLTDVTDQMNTLEKLFFGMPFSAVEEVHLEEHIS
ncbi:MAG: glutamate racemase [Spirochaetia bacterium]|nr:glutamate racemase [Spirochaetia bacterium]